MHKPMAVIVLCATALSLPCVLSVCEGLYCTSIKQYFMIDVSKVFRLLDIVIYRESTVYLLFTNMKIKKTVSFHRLSSIPTHLHINDHIYSVMHLRGP